MSVKLGVRHDRLQIRLWPKVQWRICQSSHSAPPLHQRWESRALDLLVAKDAWCGNAVGDKVKDESDALTADEEKNRNIFGVRVRMSHLKMDADVVITWAWLTVLHADVVEIKETQLIPANRSEQHRASGQACY